MGLLKRLNPATGAKDFWSEFTRPNPYRWPILGLSTLMTFGLLFLFTLERVVVPPAPPEVTYITSFAEGRSDEEIRASNIANQQRKDERAARIAEREERKRELYRMLGRASGMDVEKIEREAAAERAREEAERRALTARINEQAAQRLSEEETGPAQP